MSLQNELQRAAQVFRDPAQFYRNILNASDPRVADWMWMQSPFPTISLIMLYIVFVNIGPRMMKERQPFDMRFLLLGFNSFHVALNIWMAWELWFGMIGANYTYWPCVPMTEYSYDTNELRLARVLWWYYFAKFIDFSDTVFFILRKKNKQVSFLHVYHHASMFFFWWIGVKWVAGGQAVKGPLLNSLVHVVMYSYYALSALGPKIRPYLWWKRHITHLQLIQFFMGVFHMSYSLYEDCKFPKWMQYLGLGYLASLVILFTNFYIHAYGKRQGGSQSRRTKKKSEHLATDNTLPSPLQKGGKKDN